MKINTVIIGAQKAGTTSLYDWLGQHPEIYAPQKAKDFHFFSNDEYFKKGLAELHQRYPDYQDEEIVLHSGVNYSYFNSYTYERLLKYNSDMKVLMVLRNPVERAISAFNYFKRLNLENRNFEKAFNLDNEKSLKDYHARSNYTYVDHGFYFEQITTLRKYFPEKNFKVFIFEDMVDSKEKIYRKVLGFLDVDIQFLPDFTHENVSGQAHLDFINKILWNPDLKEKIKRVIPYHKILSKQSRGEFFHFLDSLNTSEKKEVIDKSKIHKVRNQLRNIYKEDVNKLEELLEIDLKVKWGMR